MPIYEFVCKQCRIEFKTLRPSQSANVVICPECGDGNVAQLLSLTARASSAAGASQPQSASAPCCASGGCGCRR
jgi:putative FmdB family regulatory protein